MKKYIIYLCSLTWIFSSCVKDEGNNELHSINQIDIQGIEESYSRLTGIEELNIPITITNSDPSVKESDLHYTWFLCNKGFDSNHQHTVISNEKDLNYKVNVKPADYRLYLSIEDETTGLKWEREAELNVTTPFTRGFYLFGDKEDGTCGLDFISIIADKDTTVIEDIFTNSKKLKGAKDLIFTGATYSPAPVALWAVTESGSYSMEWTSAQNEFDIIDGFTPEDFIFPTIPVASPYIMKNIYPHAYSSSNYGLNVTKRIFMTEHEFYITSIYGTEAYGNPVNRYSASSSELYQPSAYVFYPGNATYISYVTFYDKTNEAFVGLNSSYSFASNSKRYTTDSETPFYFDQTKYSPVRTLVYGENGRGNSGRSYALMNDANGDYYVYRFKAGTSTPTKIAADKIDLSAATDFGSAKQYAFYSDQPIILYAVGTKLYGYDYNRKAGKMLKDFGAEITYLASDAMSADETTDFIVATYSSLEKGTVCKYSIEDDPNEITVKAKEKEVWKTNLVVRKVEYRNCSF